MSVASVLPTPVHRLSLELLNLLASRKPGIALRLPSGESGLALSEGAPPSGATLVFSAAIGPGRLWVEVPECWLVDQLPPDVAVPSLDALPPPLAATIVSLVITPVFRSLAGLLDLALDSQPDIDALPSDAVRLALVDTGGAGPSLAVAFDKPAAQALLHALQCLQPSAGPTLDEVALLRLSIVTGQQSLTVAEFEGLAPGAVVMLAAAKRDGPRPVRAGPGLAAFGTGRIDDGALVLETVGDATMSELSDGKSLEIEPESSAFIDALEVRLDFVAGHATVAVAELRELAPGAILPLDEPAGAGVAIYTAGRRLGTGELVDIGGRIGVRLLRINRRTDG